MSVDTELSALHAVAQELCGREVDSVVRAGSGANSRIYRVACGGDTFALKAYPSRLGDPRDRLGAEVRALRFFERHALTSVPRALAVDGERGFALLEWIEGAVVTEAGPSEIDQAVRFLAAVRELNGAAGAADIPAASEACLTGAEALRQVQTRTDELRLVAEDEPALRVFLVEEFGPSLAHIGAKVKSEYAAAGLNFSAEIPVASRSLVPADFGLHNSLRRPDGTLVFFDFEYFGWDDPVKLTADFLLHPGMTLSNSAKHRFCTGVRVLFSEDSAFFTRLKLLYPLFGLRWCVIILNEFLPERWARRAQSDGPETWEGAKRRQLNLARMLLRSLSQTYRSSPYDE